MPSISDIKKNKSKHLPTNSLLIASLPSLPKTRRQYTKKRSKTSKKKNTEKEKAKEDARHKDEYIEEDEPKKEAKKEAKKETTSLPNYELVKASPISSIASAPGRLNAKAPVPKDFAKKPPITEHNLFEQKFFKEHVPQLLHNGVVLDCKDRTSANCESDDRTLFQVSCGGLSQFEKYPNLSLGTARQIDCFAQALFSLGLIESECAKENAKRINEEGTTGVFMDTAKQYLSRVFGLPQEIIHSDMSKKFTDLNKNIVAKKYINQFLKKYLKKGHATIIYLRLRDYLLVTGTTAHFLVAYRNNTRGSPIYFFDPQQQGQQPLQQTLSRTLQNLIDYGSKDYINFLGYFTTGQLDEPINPVTDSCPIMF